MSRLALGSSLLAIFVVVSSVDSVANQIPVIPADAELKLVDDDFELADGAAWDGAGQLFVPDVKKKTLRLYNLRKPDQKPKVMLEGVAISGTAFQLGRLYLSDNPGARIAFLDRPFSGGKPKTLAQFKADERPNDLTVDAHGNVYVTMTRQGTVRHISADGKFQDVATGLVAPNGIALSPSGKTLYCSSARTGVIYRIDLDKDAPADQSAQPWAQLPETDDGFRGDGMCVDRAGNVYVTGAKAVHVYDASGKSIGSIQPPQRPINAIVAGNTGQSLYLSTFGGLYAVDVGGIAVSPNPPMHGDQDAPTSTAIDESIKTSLNVVYHRDGNRELLMDVFEPQSVEAPRPAIVVVHGGGWRKGDKTKFRALALRLAELGYVTAAIEYRLAGEAHFPAAIRDCNAATAYLRKHADRFGIDPLKISAVGGSAGGHLVGLMAAGDANDQLKHRDNRDDDTSLAAAVVLAGPLEIASGSVADRSLENPDASNSVAWLGGDVNEQSALYHLADAFEQVDKTMPPTLFISGSKDNPSRNEKTRSKMKALGRPTGLVIHENAAHGHWNRPDWIQTVVTDIDQFLKRHQ
ncbi:SMP-30/gluconolactonase/LRE family protein [Roseiconus lacunae]|uniref:SMP-30/gluconolactonase/LRE family protein n=1 Tax=Roseiconus lacunae TaxID=2605694 RepID=UPI0011F3ABA0|nr:SMP-30/gluconolactonase/LRE family protein [Roseiconus lacunae]